jgi:peroxiredoxin
MKAWELFDCGRRGGVGLLLAAISVLALACSEPDGDMPSADPAPLFTLVDLEGNAVSLADYRGKTVIIDFWATWCPPCIFQVPELNKLWVAHQEQGDVAVLGVAIDVEGAEVVGPWVKEQGVEYKILIGDEGLAAEYGALGFPTLVVVRPDGTLESMHVGLIEYEALEELVRPFAAQENDASSQGA